MSSSLHITLVGEHRGPVGLRSRRPRQAAALGVDIGVGDIVLWPSGLCVPSPFPPRLPGAGAVCRIHPTRPADGTQDGAAGRDVPSLTLSGREGTDRGTFAVARRLREDEAVLCVKAGQNDKAKRTPEGAQDLGSTDGKQDNRV